jgi:rhodanese-related sulfurtransferase
MAWGLFPLAFAAAGMTLEKIGVLAAIYPAVWGLGQLFTGALSDRIGRKSLIVSGMWMQAAGIAVIAMSSGFVGFATGAVLLGAGTAMVYPTLLAAIGDVAHPTWRASSVGVYRLWRDLGYAVGAILAGLVADRFGLAASIWTIGGLTFASGAVAALRMRETLRASGHDGECMNIAELRAGLERRDAVVVLDVRSPAEFASGHIEGAVNVPLEALARSAGRLARDAALVTVCGTGGGRSAQAAKTLRELGWSQVRWLCGGTRAWHGTDPAIPTARLEPSHEQDPVHPQ